MVCICFAMLMGVDPLMDEVSEHDSSALCFELLEDILPSEEVELYSSE